MEHARIPAANPLASTRGASHGVYNASQARRPNERRAMRDINSFAVGMDAGMWR